MEWELFVTTTVYPHSEANHSCNFNHEKIYPLFHSCTYSSVSDRLLACTYYHHHNDQLLVCYTKVIEEHWHVCQECWSVEPSTASWRLARLATDKQQTDRIAS